MAKSKDELLFVGTRLSGKMLGMTAITSSCKENENCRKLSGIRGSICEKCYADKALTYRPDVANRYAINTRLLSSIIADEDLPIIKSDFCRLETHGDLVNEAHLTNYVRLARKNPQTVFGLWSKRYQLVHDYFVLYRQPLNLRLILSSPMLNHELNPVRFVREGIPVKIFTVYDKDYILEKGVEINCGGRTCMSCLRCYQPGTESIREALK
jgi:hypothetical protein